MSLSASVVVTRMLSFPAAVKQNPLKHKREHEITQNKAVLVTMHKEDDEHENTELPPPSWEALGLIGSYMEPETLAIASCVSTAWLKCFTVSALPLQVWNKSIYHVYFSFTSPGDIYLAEIGIPGKKVNYKHLPFS